MIQSSIRNQIWLIALLPLLLFVLIGNYHYINNSFDKAQQQLRDKGEIITAQLANASEYVLISANENLLNRLLLQARTHQEVISAAIFNETGRLLIKSQEDHFSPNQDNYFYYHKDIYASELPSSDPYLLQPDERELLGSIHIYVSLETLKSYKSQLITNAVFYSLVLFLMASILIYWITSRFMKPLKQLLEHLQLVESGHLDQAIQQLAKNEMGELQSGFNKMTQSLYANKLQTDQKIRTATRDLMKAVNELESQNLLLSRARNEAIEASKIKSAFLANMSHELRTPLNGIQGFVRLLEHTQLLPEQLRYIGILKQTTEDLHHHISEILDFSTIESGKLKVYYSAFNLYHLLEEVRSLLFAQTLEKPVRLYLIIFGDTPEFVVGDEHRLKQILINIAGNAIKFTDQGNVVIKAYPGEQEGHVSIEISDTGIGISESDQAQLFQAFHQLDGGNDRRYQGTGLGLVITKRIIETLKGKLDLQSSMGEGSKFTITVPLPVDPTQSPVDESDKSVVLFSNNELSRQELHSLFQRAGFFIESHTLADQDYCQLQWQEDFNHFDWLVLDIRNTGCTQADIQTIIDNKTIHSLCIHNDNQQVFELLDTYQLSGLTPSSEIRHFILNPRNTSKTQESNWQTSDIALQILVVDDNKINLAFAKELLQRWGHKTEAASNAEEALQLYSTHSFDYLLLDIQMPGKDGVQLMQEIREISGPNCPPIVALTANAQTEEKFRLLELGFDYYLSKPLDEMALNNILSATNTELASQNDEQKVGVDLDSELENPEEMLILFRKEIPEYLQDIASPMRHESQDNPVPALIHRLKGSCCYLNLPRLSRLFESMPCAYNELEKIQQELLCNSIQQELLRLQSLLPAGDDESPLT